VKILSTSGSFAVDAGTLHPICANKAQIATVLKTVDFPPELGPVMRETGEEREMLFGMYEPPDETTARSKTGCLASSNSQTLSEQNSGKQQSPNDLHAVASDKRQSNEEHARST
jgi:hypothetical protein